MKRQLLKRVKKVPSAKIIRERTYLYEEAPDHVAQVHFITGLYYVYIRKITDSYIHFVVMKSGARTTKMHRNEWEDRVQDATIRPATEKDLERFKRVTSGWRS